MGDKKYLYSTGKSRIDVYSRKVGGVVWTQTPFEAAYVLMLDNDPKVKSLASQPAKLKYKGKGFQPDFLVEYTDNTSEFIEIHTRRYTSEKYEKRIALFEEGFKSKLGVGFKFIYNDEIDLQYIRNIEHLNQYERMSPADIERVLLIASDLPAEISLGEAEEHLIEQLGFGFSVRVLMMLRWYSFDWSKKIDSETQLTRAEQ